jgi:hypothetical protein
MAAEEDDGLDEASDAKSSVGDIFGVSSGKKKKKKPKSEIVSASEIGGDDSVPFPDKSDEDDDDEVEPVKAEPKRERPASDDAPTKVAKPAKKSKAATAALDGVLRPSSDDAPAASASDDYLSPSDLGDYDGPKSKAVPMLIGIIVVLVLVIVGGGVMMTGRGGDLVALAKGEYREKKIAEARMIEEKFEADQLANLERFGNMMISGNPQYALVKLTAPCSTGVPPRGGAKFVSVRRREFRTSRSSRPTRSSSPRPALIRRRSKSPRASGKTARLATRMP